MTYTIQFRRDTAANWTSNNPVLAQDELGVETDTNKAKMGNGTAAWTALPYWDPAAVAAALAAETTARLTAEAGLAGKPATTDYVAFVSVNGNDSNDGLSWGSAKATIAAGWALLPAGGVLNLGSGTWTLTGSGLLLRGTDVEIAGQGDSTVLQPSGSMAAMLQTTASYPGARLRLSNLCIDGLFLAVNLLAYTESAFQGLECDHVTFRNPGTQGIALNGSSDAKFTNCRFTGNSQTGRPNGTMISVGSGCRRLRVLDCRFESYTNAIIGGSSTTDPYGAMIDDIEVSRCYFDGSWWLIPPATVSQAGTPVNSGGTVTYTSTVLTDTAAAFTVSLPVYGTLRVMPVRWTGTVTSVQQLALTDSAATFNATSAYGVVTRGDIVRTAAAWAMVEAAEATGITLRVSAWRSLATWQEVAAPAVSTPYTVYGMIWGQVQSNTATAITTNYWHDYHGNQVTPPAGTQYEVLAPHPNYAFNVNLGTWNVRVTDCEFFGNWADQCSTYGTEAQITGNYIHDGEDGGITMQNAGGERSIVQGNRIRHQGSSCMFLWTNNATVAGNVFQGCGWVNTSQASFLGEIDGSCQDTVFTGNVFGPLAGDIADQYYGLVLTNGFQACTGNVIAADNIFTGHTTADIWLDGLSGAGSGYAFSGNQVGAPPGAVIAYNGATPGQLLSYTGTGAPALAASVGSAYTQTDATAGGPSWTYTSSGWQQGISQVAGSLTVGGGLTSFGGYASQSLATPAGLTVTPAGTTGSTTYGYKIAAVAGNSATAPTAETEITNGNATLTGTNYNALAWTAVPNALGYAVYGRVHNSESLLATVTGGTWNDTGAAIPAANRNLLTLTSSITPSFTGGTTAGWALKGSGTTISGDTTTGPNAGGCALKIITTGTAGAGATSSPSNGPAATPGQAYTLSLYAKGSGTMLLYLCSAPADSAFATGTSITLTGTWTRYSITGTAPAGAATLYVIPECNTATTFWISAVQIDTGSSATAYIDTTPAIATPATGSQFLAGTWPGQTSPPMVISNSTGGQLFAVDTAGDVTAAGVIAANGGTNTSGTAVASAPAFVSGTARQLSAAQDAFLYINVITASVLAVAIGPTSTPANTIFASGTAAAPMTVPVRVPASWYVSVTFTSADVTFTQVTC